VESVELLFELLELLPELLLPELPEVPELPELLLPLLPELPDDDEPPDVEPPDDPDVVPEVDVSVVVAGGAARYITVRTSISIFRNSDRARRARSTSSCPDVE
jgi:hypothetical protein